MTFVTSLVFELLKNLVPNTFGTLHTSHFRLDLVELISQTCSPAASSVERIAFSISLAEECNKRMAVFAFEMCRGDNNRTRNVQR